MAHSLYTWHQVGPRGASGGLLPITDEKGFQPMVERRIELRRRYHRKKKMAKLKAKLAVAKERDKEAILRKIHALSPAWQEPATKA